MGRSSLIRSEWRVASVVMYLVALGEGGSPVASRVTYRATER
jgi:hypothetical protein